MQVTDNLYIAQARNTAKIKVFGVIGEYWNEESSQNTSQRLRAELEALESIGKNISRIDIEIDSPGGSVSHALAMYNILSKHKATKYVEYVGMSASAATVIASVANKENVKIAEYLTILIHEARLQSWETLTTAKMKKLSSDIEKINNNLAALYANQTGGTVEQMRELMATDNGEGVLLTAAEALELGFVGEVVKTAKIAAFDANYLQKIGYNNSHITKIENNMSLFGKKRAPLKTVQIENETLAFRTVAEGESVEVLGSENEYTGSFAYENKTVIVENGKIKEVSEAKADDYVAFINSLFEPIKAQIAEMQKAHGEQVTEMVSEIESANDRIESLEKKLAIATRTASPATLPVNEQQKDEVKATADPRNILKNEQRENSQSYKKRKFGI